MKIIKNRKIWIVDDERIVRVTLADELRDSGYDVREFSNGNTLLSEIVKDSPDIVITDYKMPGINGLELLTKIKELKPDTQVILMTAFGTIENAVTAMKVGAFDYITKPFNYDEIKITIERTLEYGSIKKEYRQLKEKIEGNFDFSSYIGDPGLNQELFRLIKLVAEKDSTVLVTGETGTGKELIANIIHYNSSRKDKPFVKVSCAILSREIFESELFGHIKGAFTGADYDKQGRFELADTGTLYLDDIDDIPLDLQVKLLRALEQREIEKVGSAKPIPVDIRLIASTKKDLLELVKMDKFREDLYYRLNIFPISLAPLRDRRKDIKTILLHFLRKFSGNPKCEISNEAIQILQQYSWPGNVRELKNIAERLAILSHNGNIELADIPMEIKNNKNMDICSSVGSKSLEQLIAEVEINAIKCALEKSRNHKSKAAEILGLPPSTLRTKMDKYGLE